MKIGYRGLSGRWTAEELSGGLRSLSRGSNRTDALCMDVYYLVLLHRTGFCLVKIRKVVGINRTVDSDLFRFWTSRLPYLWSFAKKFFVGFWKLYHYSGLFSFLGLGWPPGPKFLIFQELMLEYAKISRMLCSFSFFLFSFLFHIFWLVDNRWILISEC